MYARLWWKDARQFWPIWGVLVVAAAATQCVILSYVGPPARLGALGIVALGWASLYALTAGAAAFAGERETGTLRLLDIIPVNRHVVWASKVSFALVTSAALTLVLLVMAAWSTDRWNPAAPLTASQAICCSMAVVVALGWGLFWSSILKTALTSAVAAICCTGLTLTIAWWTYLDLSVRDRTDAVSVAEFEFVVIGVTAAASAAFFTRFAPLKRIPLEFRSPIVMTRARSPKPPRMQLETPDTVFRAPSPRPMAVTGTPEAFGAIPSTRWSWLVEARTLARQTIKEGMKTWSLLAAIALAPAVLAILFQSYLDITWLVLVSVLGVLVAGASVFGLENRERTHRFLAHHGARPGLVWIVKLSVWLAGVAVIAASLAFLSRMVTIARPGGGPDQIWTQSILALSITFVVAMLCGMAFRRGITALVIGLVLAFGVAMPLLILISMHMLPATGLAFVPLALLAVSWGWKKDWMLDRPAPGRWLRLGLSLTAAFSLLSASYIGFRVWSVPDLGVITAPAAWNNASVAFLSPDRNAANLYREAGRRLKGPVDSPEFLGRNKETLDLIRRAAALPDCWFEQPDEWTLFHPGEPQRVDLFAGLVSSEARNRLGQGDLAGSWDDILVLFHMARHFSEGSGGAPGVKILTLVERDALGLGMEWAVARGQTTERLHAALAAYREMPKMPPATDVLRAEAMIVENTLDLPTSKFHEWVHGYLNEGHQSAESLTNDVSSWILTPWELARARRVNRVVAADAIQVASREPGQRPKTSSWGGTDPRVRYAWATTPALIKGLFWNWEPYVFADDHNEVARRALVQVLAIRAWQLRHGGQFPDRLEALVPEELASLPKDPYSDGPFGFLPSRGKSVPPLRDALYDATKVYAYHGLVVPPAGSWLLYSVEPGRYDDLSNVSSDDVLESRWPRDIVFVIPPVEGPAASAKDKPGAAEKDHPASASPK